MLPFLLALFGSDAEWPRRFLIDDFYDFTDAVADKIGAPLTYVLMTYGMLKVQLMVGHYLFILAERKRWIAKYKIQKDKYMPDELVDKMWKANYGTDFILPFFIVALPMSLSDYALQRFAGLDIRDRSQGWTELAWKMPIAVFIWDLIIWVAHVAFHKVPGWYKRFHAYHHEHQYPNVLAASQFSLIDAIWETTAPVYIGCAMTGMSLFGCYFFQGVFLFWVGLHNHSGYDMPYDFLNKIFRYVDKHDAHHELFNTCYQTFLWGIFDKPFGFEEGYNRLVEKKKKEQEGKN